MDKFIYLLRQNKNTGYDTFDSCVVVAESEGKARNMHPFYGGDTWMNEDGPEYFSDWAKPEDVEVIKIGIVSADVYDKIPVGVVCYSFNAG